MTASVQMVASSSVFLAKSATIAIRYNAVRLQGFVSAGKQTSYRSPENKIMDYKMNQYVLLRELALAYAIRFTSTSLSDRMSEIQKNPYDADDLPDMHACSAGLKGYCCNAVAIGIEKLRKYSGGYLMASGIAQLAADYRWRASAEGDSVVMNLQTAKFLMKAASDAASGKPLSGLSAALSVLGDPDFSINKIRPATQMEEFMSIDYLLSLFRFRSVLQVKLTKNALDARMNSGMDFDQAWTELTMKACRTGQSHVLFFMLTKFDEMVKTCEDDKYRSVLQNLCLLFALSDLIDGKQWIGLTNLEEFELVEQATSKLCSLLLPEMVLLVDSWDFHDKSLNSTIGNFNGDIYEQQYLAAANAPINQQLVPGYFRLLNLIWTWTS